MPMDLGFAIERKQNICRMSFNGHSKPSKCGNGLQRCMLCLNMVRYQSAYYRSDDIRGFLINKANNKLRRIPYNVRNIPNKQQYHT